MKYAASTAKVNEQLIRYENVHYLGQL